MNKENKIKVTPAKGRPMLHWVGKKSLDSSILERFEGGEFSLKKKVLLANQ